MRPASRFELPVLGHIKNYLNTDKRKEAAAADQKVPLKDQVNSIPALSEQTTVVCFVF